MAKHKRRDSLVWGIILIGLGFIFLFESFDVDVWDALWRFWPVILIIWGANKLYFGLKERNAQNQPPPGPPQE